MVVTFVVEEREEFVFNTHNRPDFILPHRGDTIEIPGVDKQMLVSSIKKIYAEPKIYADGAETPIELKEVVVRCRFESCLL